jgi:hypothetical protein
LKTLPGIASTVTVGGLADLDIDDVGFVHLHLGGDHAHIGQGHQRGAFGVLNADDHRFSLADGQVGHDAVKGGDGDGLAQHVLVEAQRGDLGLQVAALGIGLRLGLIEAGDCLASEATSVS